MTLPELTEEQQEFVDHIGGAFVEACPGAGKTRAIVSRIHRLGQTLPPRKGVAVLSFTNTAVDEFKERCFALDLESSLRLPGFIGTFDAFIRHFFVLPGGIPGVLARPHIVDSWKTLGIDIRLRGAAAFHTGVSLDNFDAVDGTIDPDSIGNNALKRHIQGNLAQYQAAATARRNALRRNGILSVADARIVAIQNLGRAGWEDALRDSLAARFSEIIVDEAQDCNDVDLALLGLLKDSGIPVTIVCDPDQAIYQFRHGNPSELGEFRDKYAAENRLMLTGNFRSSPGICNLAATLRERDAPDVALGEYRDVDIPIQILEYGGATVQPSIGQRFSALADESGIPLGQAYILAHGRNAAFRAVGKGNTTSNSEAKIAIMATAVGSYWASSGSGKTREKALRAVEKLILQLMGKINDVEPLSKTIERNDLNVRWLRRTALEFLTSLPKNCNHTDAGRTAWLQSVQTVAQNIGLELAEGQRVTNFFSNRGGNDWSKALQVDVEQVALPCATVHEAKGREYDAVCLVIPPDRAPQNNTEQLLVAWEGRVSDEAKRVAYVAITRAKKLAAIAVPSAYLGRLIAILDAGDVP